MIRFQRQAMIPPFQVTDAKVIVKNQLVNCNHQVSGLRIEVLTSRMRVKQVIAAVAPIIAASVL